MAKTMTKSDLVEALAKDGLTKAQAQTALNTFVSTVTSSLKKGDKVQITGFGTFEVRSRKARQGVNPSTGEKIKIKASKAPAFKAGSSLKDAVNKK